MKSFFYIGLMTGTVLDGEIDLAAMAIAADGSLKFGPVDTGYYQSKTCALIRDSMIEAARWQFTGPQPEIFLETERAITEDQAVAVREFMDKNGLSQAEVQAIGFHGQTVLHRAPTASKIGATKQLGNGALMAQLTRIKTICDFRRNDVEHGGNGAPLAPIYHHALIRQAGLENVCLLNLGGVGNLTWVGPSGEKLSSDEFDHMIAFDTGPANAPINDWVASHSNHRFDLGGSLALTGRVDETRIQNALKHPFFEKDPPKSLDRNSFTSTLATGLSLEDGAATLAAFAAACVANGLKLLPYRPKALFVTGGGRHNAFLMQELTKRTQIDVKDVTMLDVNGDALEAQCFAYLAYRRLYDLPISFPTTTGVPTPLTGGVIHDVKQ